MPRALFALLVAMTLAGTAEAASFSLVPTSSLFIGQGEFASFDVWYTADPEDRPPIAVNLRIAYEHDRRPFRGDENVVTIEGNNKHNPFEIPTFSTNECFGPFVCPAAVDIGGSQWALAPVDVADRIKLGEVAFGTEGPFMGNAGIITLRSVARLTGSRDADFGVIPDTTPDVLAVIYVPEASATLLLLIGIVGLRALRRNVDV